MFFKTYFHLTIGIRHSPSPYFHISSQKLFRTSRNKCHKWCFSLTKYERSGKHSFSCQESEGAESGRHPLQILLLITFPCKWVNDRLECVLRPLHGCCRKGGFIERSWLLKLIEDGSVIEWSYCRLCM